MITNFKNPPSKKSEDKRNSVIFVASIIVVFVLAGWMIMPPIDKISQICYWGNNVHFFFAKLTGSSAATEYIFHRNNAIYLAKMYRNKKIALTEMNKAIETLPIYASDDELKTLYKERAEIKLYLGEYKSALNDYINSDKITFNDNLKVAMLFKMVGNYRAALSFCNNIINADSAAYAGFACMADLYISAGRPDVALNVWDLAIDRNKNNPRAYADRALVKKSIGDMEGYNKDVKMAKEYSPGINIEKSIIEETLHPKILTLAIRR